MSVIQNGTSRYPFWGASYQLITGLDPLGLQTTSEAIYTRLLPGVSNVTNRLRYYGFYCWLLEFYFKLEKEGNSIEQNRFIRRAELLIALMMQYGQPEIQQITGSSFARMLLQQSANDEFDLAAGADLDSSKEPLYWKYPTGAFGQYYYGALALLGLAITAQKDNVTIYKATQSCPEDSLCGKDLAEAFDASLDQEARDLFYAAVKRGRVTTDELEYLLLYFSIDRIPVDSLEGEYYASILLGRDNPGEEWNEATTGYRRETILGLLWTATESEEGTFTSTYIQQCYQNQLGTAGEPASPEQTGWYAYQLNEYWQFACGALFWGGQRLLSQGPGERRLFAFVEELSAGIVRQLVRSYGFDDTAQPTGRDVLNATPAFWQEQEIEAEINAVVKKAKLPAEGIEAAAAGFRLLWLLLKKNGESLPSIGEYLLRQGMERDGNAVEGLSYLSAQMERPIHELVRTFLLQKIIYRHQVVALRKMGNGNLSTQKFYLEDGTIRFIDNFSPRHTSPRMGALQNLLFDLRLIDEQNHITKPGLQLLSH